MTKGDKIKLRADLAGRAMQGLGTWIPPADYGPFNWGDREAVCGLKSRWAVAQADALMAELGISLDKED